MLTATFSVPASFVAYNILRLPRRSHSGRSTKIFLTFFVSGILHTSVDLAAGISWQESGSLRFFCMQALGIIVESSLESAVYSYGARKAGGQFQPVMSPWTRPLGFVWTVAFLVWSTPAYSYPAIRRAEGGTRDIPLPLSVINLFLRIRR